jgi:hypothetical protein
MSIPDQRVSFMGSTVPKGSLGSMAPHHSPSRGHTTLSWVPNTLPENRGVGKTNTEGGARGSADIMRERVKDFSSNATQHETQDSFLK